MSTPTWIAPLPRIAVWLCLYLILAAGRFQLERWLIARFQRRGRGTRGQIFPAIDLLHEELCGLVWPAGRRLPSGPALLRAGAVLAALLSGAAIPLAPEIQIGHWKVSPHLLGNAQAALLYVLASEWIGTGLLTLAGRGSVRQPARTGWRAGGLLLLDALPVALITLSLVVTSGALDVRREGSLRLTRLVALQGEGLARGIDWSNVRWWAAFQPFVMPLWLACTMPFRPGFGTRMTFAWQAQALNRALLTSALFLGGWQGPFVEQCAWLGLPYTAIKAGIVTSVWVWACASLPLSDLVVRMRVVWRVFVPVAALNLLLTSVIVARL
jgi:NADH:ubiquinone oxidoreductase subunit H